SMEREMSTASTSSRSTARSPERAFAGQSAKAQQKSETASNGRQPRASFMFRTIPPLPQQPFADMAVAVIIVSGRRPVARPDNARTRLHTCDLEHKLALDAIDYTLARPDRHGEGTLAADHAVPEIPVDSPDLEKAQRLVGGLQYRQ